MKITFAEAVRRARAMISLSPADESLGLDDAIAEVRSILAADDTPPRPDLDEAINEVRTLMSEQRAARTTHVIEHLRYSLDDQYEDEEISDLFAAYLRSQRDLNTLIGNMALRNGTSTGRTELVVENGKISDRRDYHRPSRLAALTAG